MKTVGLGILERRLTHGPGYRVYFTQRDNRVMLLLCGGEKTSQQGDITKAQQLAAKWHMNEDDNER